MRVVVPTHLRSYTGGAAAVDAEGATLGEGLDDLDARFPGLRFRVVDEQGGIRPHVKFFIDGEQALALTATVGEEATVRIVAALSGG